jgi:flavodoxin I
MKKTALLYWAPGGNVEKAARTIFDTLNSDQVEISTVAGFDPGRIGEYDQFIFGCATIGAEVWLDARADNKWNEFFVKTEGMSFAGKKFALFGLGDQVKYSENFVDSLGYLKSEIEGRGGIIVGRWPVAGYKFFDSEGASGGYFFGLALDEDYQADLTPGRISRWVEQIKSEF